MRQREKYGRLSEADRVEIGDRIKNGQTHAEVAAAVGCSTKSVQRLLIRTGGLAPRGRNRSPHHLTVAEREEISRGLKAGDSCRAIAGRLGRAPSTISREVAANGSRERYRAWRAERRASGEGSPPEGGEARPVPSVAAEGGTFARRALVSAADCPSPSARSPLGSRDARVSRDDLPVAVRADARRAQEGTHGLPAHRPDATTITKAQTRRGAAEGHGLHLRAARRGRGPGRTGPLGRGPDPRQAGTIRDRSPRRAPQPLRVPFAPSRRADRSACAPRAGRADGHAAGPAQALAHLGPRQGDGPARPLQHRERRVGLLSAIRGAPGSAGPARTPTACSANTSPRAPISPPTHRPTSMPPPGNSMAALDKPSTG